MAHGIRFRMHERQPPNDGRRASAEVAVRGRKVQVAGSVSLTLATGQRKFGDELIAQVYTQQPIRVRDRRDDSWCRVQVFLGPADLATAEVLERLARDIRARLESKDSVSMAPP